ncbi:hypothetical protein P9112_010822 [Eukaryota sp. TZLM1-RC]
MDQWEFLVPIRLDLEYEDNRLVDCFLWNPNDKDYLPFATQLVSDMNLPPVFVQMIVDSIGFQLSPDHYPYFKISPDKPGELRILVKLDIAIGSTRLRDLFELDINNPQNSPELIAENLVLELGLAPVFKSAISHSIREQIGRTMMLVSQNRTGEAPILPQVIDDHYRFPSELPAFTPRVETVANVEDLPPAYPPSGTAEGGGDEDMAMESPEFKFKDFKRATNPLDSRKYNLGPLGPLFPDELRKKVEDGSTALDIAMEHQVTIPTIRKRMEQANVPRDLWFRRPHTREIIEALDAIKEDSTAETVNVPRAVIQEIGAKYGYTEAEVLNVYNNTVRTGYVFSEEIFMLFHATNTPLVAIADAVGMPIRQVKKFIKNSKLLPEEVLRENQYKVKFIDNADIDFLFSKGYNVFQVADVMGMTIAELSRLKTQLGH